MTLFNSEKNSPFARRHIGPNDQDIDAMLKALNLKSLDDLVENVIPNNILDSELSNIPGPVSEEEALQELSSIAAQNKINKSLIGQGYYDTFTPQVITRNVLENPGWYTAYTPYQPEISQGRLEVLFNFQTLICELTGLDIANASLLDEATAAAEAMALAHRAKRQKFNTLYISKHLFKQTKSVLNTRAAPIGIKIIEFDDNEPPLFDDAFAVMVQYPRANGDVINYHKLSKATKESDAVFIMIADLLALTMIESPASIGADIAVGSAQRFGVPMGFGGPHAAYMAVMDKYKRSMPGRLVGETVDSTGKPCYRLALQTREQHIRREKATSNICTAQALLAIMATLYACYHGPNGLHAIAKRISDYTSSLRLNLKKAGCNVVTERPFDTLEISVDDANKTIDAFAEEGINVYKFDDTTIRLSLDETTQPQDLNAIASLLLGDSVEVKLSESFTDYLDRPIDYLSQDCFNSYFSETAMMRYLRLLASKDIALDQAMIPLGSCTMKLNASAEMAPVTWPQFAALHPFAPANQRQGYDRLISDLDNWLSNITGYAKISFQPNAGSQGEYAGLLAIMSYHKSRDDHDRTICLIPQSAHGTNPASAHMCGMEVVVVATDDRGNIDIEDLKLKINENEKHIAAIMLTYPSTHGVYEKGLRTVCDLVHNAGGQVYIDGANMNAQVGLAKPGSAGGDVSHLNLHKTFCIPHGGGGPGVGPIGVAEHLVPFLPGHQIFEDDNNTVSAAPWGSASILPITWMYIRMMGAEGLRKATAVAILSANYIVHRLKESYPVLYTDENGWIAHECILDTRVMKDYASVDDIAKRLIDYGFHAPTMSFPVAGTLMVEPTESEPMSEINRFCDAMLRIFKEYENVRDGIWPKDENPLCNAPHTADLMLSEEWSYGYTRKQAAFPAGATQMDYKYWPRVARVDNVHGDKHLICSCPPLEAYQ